MSPGKLKSGSCACVGIPSEHECQGSGQTICCMLGGMERKGLSVRKKKKQNQKQGAQKNGATHSVTAYQHPSCDSRFLGEGGYSPHIGMQIREIGMSIHSSRLVVRVGKAIRVEKVGMVHHPLLFFCRKSL